MVKHLKEFDGTLHRDLSEALMNNPVVGVRAGAAGSRRNNLVLQQCGKKQMAERRPRMLKLSEFFIESFEQAKQNFQDC